MRRLGLYIFLKLLASFLGILVTLTGIVWVTQALRRFDLVTSKGQAIASYLGMTLLAVPFLVTIVAPFAMIIAMVVVLNSLHADSELVAMNAAGASHRQVLQPFMALAILVATLVCWMTLWSGPQALQTLRDMTNRIRADIVTSVIQPGRFVDVDENVTFHIRNRAGDGSLEGLFIADKRDPQYGYTYSAERGRIVEALGRSLLVMENGTVERRHLADSATTFVAFGSYAFDLSELKPDTENRPYTVTERTISELLSPDPTDRYRAEHEENFRAEIMQRFAAPIYPLVMALAVFLFLGFPRTTRTGRGVAVFGAISAAVACRLVGFALAGLSGNDDSLLLILIAPLAMLFLIGFSVLAGIEPYLPAVIARPVSLFGQALGRLFSRFLPKGTA